MAFLASDEIHLLLVDEEKVGDELLAQYSALLSPDELARHERIRTPADRRRFLITRAAVRAALSHFDPEVSPADWQFTANGHGRPAIAGPVHAASLTFNISHVPGLIIIGVAREGRLGVDVENVDRVVDALALARRYFAPEEVSEFQALALAEQSTRFFELWTLKEAWVKALGMGLARSLRHASFNFSNSRIEVTFTKESKESSDHWQFWQLCPSEHHQIAVAYACGSGPSPRLLMKLLVSEMFPLKSISPTSLSPSRTS